MRNKQRRIANAYETSLFFAWLRKTEPRLDTTVEDYLAKGEEFAYLFENNEWVCYQLPYEGEPYIVEIKEAANAS